jgi:hypothetical protein
MNLHLGVEKHFGSVIYWAPLKVGRSVLFSKTPNLSPSPPLPQKKTKKKKTCGNKRTCGVVPNTNKMNPNRPPFFQNTVKGKAHPRKLARRLRRREGERREERREERRTSERASARAYIDEDLLLSLLWSESATRMRERRGVCCWRIWEPVGEELSTRASWWVFLLLFFFSPVWKLAFLLMLIGIHEFLQLFFIFGWVSECVSEWEEVGTLCAGARACVCMPKGYPVGLFFVPRLRISWGAAICCCCSAAASVVMWGCRKWHSLLER